MGKRGFIAQHLHRWCERNGIDSLLVGSEQIDLTVRNNASKLADILKPSDSIVMTSSLPPDKGRDHRAFMVNVRMVETVCIALEKTACVHLVYLSSDAVYDAAKTPLVEDSSTEPLDHYALSHIAREMMFSSALDQAKIPLCVLRFTNIFGPGDTHNAYGPNRFVRSALNEGTIKLFGKGEERRSHVYIDDAVELIALSLTHRSIGTLNVAASNAISFNSIAQEVTALVGKPVQFKYLERQLKVLHKPYKPTQVFRFLYNLGRPIGPIVHRTFVNSAIFKAFPDFHFTSLKTALGKFIESEKSIPNRGLK
jgi:UDP-glucose 4-epimerase